MMNETAKMLMQKVYETGFALDDIVLYLDTHPYDQEALNYYRSLMKMRDDAVTAYENQVGPLMTGAVRNSNEWTWLSDPWPWEGEV